MLDRDNLWLRELVVVSEKERAKFWKKMAAGKGRACSRALSKQRSPMPCRSHDFQSRHLGGVPVPEVSAGRGGSVLPIGGRSHCSRSQGVVKSAWSAAHGLTNGEIRVSEIAIVDSGRWTRGTGSKTTWQCGAFRQTTARSKWRKANSTLFTSRHASNDGLRTRQCAPRSADRRDAIKRDLEGEAWMVDNQRQEGRRRDDARILRLGREDRSASM